jgi:ribonuclease HII
MLKSWYNADIIEAGCDEAGRGCLAGPVYSAAVILPKNFRNETLRDSKMLSSKKRQELRVLIENESLAWAVASVDPEEIDRINILQASFLAMHKAIRSLTMEPRLLLIDGNRFVPYENIPHICFIKGDDLYLSIAAASVLAKTHRDAFMTKIHAEFPEYNWIRNKGYGSLQHRETISRLGMTPYHRKSFKWSLQLKLPFN